MKMVKVCVVTTMTDDRNEQQHTKQRAVSLPLEGSLQTDDGGTFPIFWIQQ